MRADYRIPTQISAPAEPLDLAMWHPALRRMVAVAERMIERNDSRGWAILVALAKLNGHRSFWRGAT